MRATRHKEAVLRQLPKPPVASAFHTRATGNEIRRHAAPTLNSGMGPLYVAALTVLPAVELTKCPPAVNVDYDYLKDLIKHQTTSGSSKAVSIPGQGKTTERAFGDTFYKALKAQHDRINLFIRSKTGEIERRLEHINRSLKQLQTRQGSNGPSDRLPARIVEKYAKIDADVTK